MRSAAVGAPHNQLLQPDERVGRFAPSPVRRFVEGET
jgi:hypothetical protein